MQITAEVLRERFDYDPETGRLVWRVTNRHATNIKPGDVAGHLHKGYRRVKFQGRCLSAHRLIWLYMTGSWPAAEVDHRNGVRDDNRWANLRAATHAENAQNRKPRAGARSGVAGVSWSGGRWHAVIMVNGKQKSIGRFDEAHLDLAIAARRAAEAELFTHRRAA